MGGGISSYERADLNCQNETNNLIGSRVKGKTFKAWVPRPLPIIYSTTGDSFNRYELPYKRVNGATVALNYIGLVSGGALLSPINRTASGGSNH